MLSRLLLVTCAAAGLQAQAVFRVGPGGFAEIQPAIAAASACDVIEVAPGNYAPFTLDKALTITALPGGRVSILPGLGTPNLLRPPAGSVARLVGIEFRHPWYLFAAPLRIERGTVWLQDCVCEGPQAYGTPGLAVTGADAILDRCAVVGFGVATGSAAWLADGLVVINGRLSATDCWFAGADTGLDLAAAGAGLSADNSVVHLVRCRVDGGDNDPFCLYAPGQGIRARNGSRLWLADCTVTGGNGGCRAGGVGLDNQGQLPVVVARCMLQGGSGTPTGAATAGPVTTGALLGLGSRSMPLRLGQPFVASWRTEPNWPVVAMIANDLSMHPEPFLVQPALLPAAAATTFALLVADGNGDAALTTAVPANPLLLYHAAWLQAGSGLGLPLQASTALGGVIR